MTVRFTEEQDAQLTQLSNVWGVSKQQALVRAVENSIEAMPKQQIFEAAIERTLNRYSDLLRRLGE